MPTPTFAFRRMCRRRDDPNSAFAVGKRTATESLGGGLIMRAVARPYQTGSDEAA